MHYHENMQFIESVPIFKILTHAQKDALVSCLSTQKFTQQQKIVNEGDPGDLFYMIKEGTVTCIKGGYEIRMMGKGDYFGEQSLLHNSVRTASIIANTNVKCLAIGRESLTKVLGNKLQQIIYINSQRIALEKSSCLVMLTKEQIESTIKAMKINTYLRGQAVITAGSEKGRHLWILLKGGLVSQRAEVKIRGLTCFGDEEIVKETSGVYSFDLIAEEDDTVVSKCEEIEFENAIGGKYCNIIIKNEALNVLKKVSIFRDLSNEEFFSLLDQLKLEHFEDSELIFRQHDPGNSFFIIKSGKVDVTKNGVIIRTINKHDYFGERSILLNEPRSATVRARGHLVC